MAEVARYEIEFVQRTKHILKHYRGKYKLTNTINCTLGLIILPNEIINERPGSIWQVEVTEIPELAELKLKLFDPIRGIRNGEINYFPKTLKILLKKIRNGLAHQHIETVNINGIFKGVIIKNYFGPGIINQDLEIEFSRSELEKFAIFIADRYLNYIST